MTLLLNLIGPSGIHQSSDYRLTDIATRQPIEDELGSKQLDARLPKWTARISFTGLAQVGGRKTREWISEVFNDSHSLTAQDAVSRLASRATSELRALPANLGELTIVVTVTAADTSDRLFVVSRRGPIGPVAAGTDEFAVSDFTCTKPRVLIFGYVQAVTSEDKKLLKALSAADRDPAEIRRVLGQVNLRSAKNSQGFISEGCLVSSVLPNGHSAVENFGGTPGVPEIVGSPGAAKAIEAFARTAFPGKRPSFVQSREFHGRGPRNFVTTQPMNVSEGNMLVVQAAADAYIVFLTDSNGNTFTQSSPNARCDDLEEELKFERDLGPAVGEPRTIAFSFPNYSGSILTPDGSTVGSIVFGGEHGKFTLRKNELVRTVVNTITVTLDPQFKFAEKPFSMRGTFPVLPTVDGVQPHSWIYTIEPTFGANCSFVILRNGACQRV
jgi:hypothetical protein